MTSNTGLWTLIGGFTLFMSQLRFYWPTTYLLSFNVSLLTTRLVAYPYNSCDINELWLILHSLFQRTFQLVCFAIICCLYWPLREEVSLIRNLTASFPTQPYQDSVTVTTRTSHLFWLLEGSKLLTFFIQYSARFYSSETLKCFFMPLDQAWDTYLYLIIYYFSSTEIPLFVLLINIDCVFHKA